MDRNFLRFKWILLFAVFLMGQFFLNSSACAEWTTIVNPPDVSSDWDLLHSRSSWAVGQDLENGRGVLLYFLNGSWIPATLPDVSSEWGLSGVDLTSSSHGWAVGQDFENGRGVLLYFRIPSIAALPTVITTAISDITDTTATGGGNITSDGGTEVTAKGICWSTSEDPTVEDTCTSDGTGTGEFTSSITGLEPRTLYHVRAYATNSAGTAYGNDIIFSTTAPRPTVTTTAISDITSTTATGGGNITSDGGNPITARGVCWSTSPNPVFGGDCTKDGTGKGVFISHITNLIPSSLYHVRAYATNSVGTAYGNELTFTTTASALTLPILSTTPTSNRAAIAASGGGLIWPCVSVDPPPVSSDWGLSAVHFFSSDEGWAVGKDSEKKDSENGRGVLLHFLNGSWVSVVPPDVSSDWGLSAVHFIWAVGQDLENGRGVILRSAGDSWKSVDTEKVIPPEVSSNWGLSAVHFLSSDEAWAVGEDFENGRGVLLHFSGGSWESVVPPDVSSNWGLSSVDFIHSHKQWEGWAVGEDFENKRGVLLHFSGGSWTSVIPPDVSSDWGLSGIHLSSANRGWAVGWDGSNLKGVLLKYTAQISVSPMSIEFNDVEIGALLEKTVTVRNTGKGNLDIGSITAPSPPFSKSADSCSGKSLAPSHACKVTYGFLPDSAVTFFGSSNIPSNGSSGGFDQRTVMLTGNGAYIHLLSPSDGKTFTAGDYSNPPTFQWESSGTFTSVTSIEVQFSLKNDFSTVSLKVRGDPNVNQLIIRSYVWKRVLLLPGVDGGTVYWRVLAKKKDKTMVESNIFSFDVTLP